MRCVIYFYNFFDNDIHNKSVSNEQPTIPALCACVCVCVCESVSSRVICHFVVLCGVRHCFFPVGFAI